MSWREAVEPVRMERVAVVAPRPCLRDALVLVAASGQVDLDPPVSTEHTAGPAARRLQSMVGDQPVRPALADHEIDLDRLVELGRADLVAGEA
jgi:V/A-type H+-transporting ATPase subunit I